MSLHAGDMLTENLRLERELGSGAMGTVWVAQNRALGSQVAVKVLRTAGNDPEVHARFSQEARGLAQLDSPHVVRVFDFGVTPHGEPFIVMELLRGEDLAARIERQGPLSLDDTVTIIEQVCRALSSAHKQGIIHRDIKPANIFLTDVEGALFVKVLDFGVAKYAGAANLGMTATGAMVGTPYYMSPEQLLDPKSIDHRSDLWSIAVVAYACLAGTVPFQGDTVGALSVAVHSGTYPPLASMRGDLPPAIEAWIRRALSRDMGQRYQSAMELASTLAQASRGAAVPTSLPVSVPVASPAVSQTPAHWQPPPQPVMAPMPAQPLAPTAPPARGASSVVLGLAALLLLGGGVVGGWLLLGSSSSDRDGGRKRDRDTEERADHDREATPKASASSVASAAASDAVAATTPKPTAVAVKSQPPPAPAPQTPQFLWSKTTCAKSKGGQCIPCCNQPRMVMAPDCKCMYPVCKPNESPIPDHCMRTR